MYLLIKSRYAVQLKPIFPQQLDPDVRDRQEQLHTTPLRANRPSLSPRTITSISAIKFDQSEIVNHMPYGIQICGYTGDRPNFHGCIFCFRADPSVLGISTNIECPEFDNKPGIRHIRWQISQATGTDLSTRLRNSLY